MKLYISLFLMLQLFTATFCAQQNLLSNQEIKEILKCFGDLDLEEGCVICRYVTQKIYKVLDISAMCPDVVDTKLLTQRQREWKPDPKTINKCKTSTKIGIVLFNLQKDYMERIKPEIDNVKNYDKQMHEKLLKEKIEKENLANLVEFQNKVNSDLAHTANPYAKEFTKDHCDDEDLKYKHLQSVSPQTGIIDDPTKTMMQNDRILNGPSNTINNFTNISKASSKPLESNNMSLLKKKMQDFVNSSNKNSAISNISNQSTINSLNQEILKQKMAQFFVQPSSTNFEVLHDDIHHIDLNDPNLIIHHEMPSKINMDNFKFRQNNQKKSMNQINNIEVMNPPQNFNNFELPNENKFQMLNQNSNPFQALYLNQNQYDKNVIPQANFDFITKEMKENGSIQYLGSSIGNPYAGFKNNRQMESKISDYVKKMNNKRRSNQNHVNRKEIERIKHRIVKASQRVNNAFNKNISNVEVKDNKKNLDNVVKSQQNNNQAKKNLQRNTSFKQINTPNNNENEIKIRGFKNQANEVIFNKDEDSTFNNKIANPPSFESFIQTKEDVHFDKNFFSNLIEKSQNFNLETQRRGRRRSRFPDPQWDCAEMQVAKIVRYLCEEELSASYQKYCKPIFEQINTMVESFLYHDNNLEICQNLHMCPVTIDIHYNHSKE